MALDDALGALESSSGVADAAFDLGVLPNVRSADTTKLYVFPVANPLTTYEVVLPLVFPTSS